MGFRRRTTHTYGHGPCQHSTQGKATACQRGISTRARMIVGSSNKTFPCIELQRRKEKKEKGENKKTNSQTHTHMAAHTHTHTDVGAPTVALFSLSLFKNRCTCQLLFCSIPAHLAHKPGFAIQLHHNPSACKRRTAGTAPSASC